MTTWLSISDDSAAGFDCDIMGNNSKNRGVPRTIVRVGLYSLRSRSLWSPPCRVTIPNAKMLFLPIQEFGSFLQPFIHQCSKFASIDRADFRFIFILGIEEIYYRIVLVNLE